MTDTIHVILNWDFGAGETEEDLTLAELGALIQNGRADDSEGRVTTVTIWTADALACVTCGQSEETHGPTPAPGACTEYNRPG